MSLKFQVKLEFTEEKHFFNGFFNDIPFVIESNLKELCKFYDLDLLKIELFSEESLDWAGLFFHKTIDGKVYIFSGGRFGFTGFMPKNHKYSVSSYLPLIEDQLVKMNIGSCSLALSFLADHTMESVAVWQTSSISYLVANTDESVDQDGLCFRKAKTRSGLSRSLIKAKEQGFLCKEVTDYESVKSWHKHCHLPRIKELNGIEWDFQLLLNCIANGTASLVCVFDHQANIIGGCYIFKSRLVLELFMMSTSRENQILGVNSILIEHLYLMAKREGISYVNWQASNPPEGSLVRFKKDWNAKNYNFNIYNKSFDNSLDKSFIEANFKDCYIFPFSELIK